MTAYNYNLDLYAKEVQCLRFKKDKNDFYLSFDPGKIKSMDGTLVLMGVDANFYCDFDAFDYDYPTEEESAKARKEFNEKVRVENATFTKVSIYGVNKYIDL